MSTNAPGVRSLLDLAPGLAVPSGISHLGLEYPGEVVLAPTWQRALGEPLSGDVFFRIVFLQSYASVAPQELQDTRIVVCVPPRSDRPRERTLEMERRVVRELRSRYRTTQSEQALQEPDRQIYASGTLVTRAALDLRPQVVFSEPSAEVWISALGRALLAWTYPRLPLDSSSFPRPLTSADVGPLFQGLVQEDSAPEVASTVEVFGPGLGLAPPGGTEERGVQEGQVFSVLHTEMAQRGGSWPCAELYQRLAHVYGLPHPLISLYLLAFVRRSRLPVELQLRPGHGLRLRDGQAYPGQVVVQETVGSLDFVPRLDAEGQLLRYATPASWGTISLYFSWLEPALAPADQVDEPALALRLMETLAALHSQVQQVERALERLASALGDEIPQGAVALLNRFRRLSRARAPEEALLRARQLFATPQGLSQAIAGFRGLRQVAGLSSQIARAARYIQNAHVPDELRDLALQRQTLVALLHMRELTTSFSAQVVQGQIARFQEEYQRAYATHHEEYNRTLAAMLRRLGESQGESRALERLNSVPELGDPVGTPAVERYHQLTASLTPCPITRSRLSLTRSPRCRSCGMVLGQQPPLEEIESIVEEIQGGLKEQSRRLSALVVQRILQRPIDSRMARFIRMVEASNVSGLVQVLDAPLVSFIREVLQGP